MNSIYKNLHISNCDEIIIATVRNKDISGGLFTKERLAITNRAIYTSGNNFFPLEKMYQYIVTMSKDGHYIYLTNQDGQYLVMGRFFDTSSKDKAEKSVLKIIKAVQIVAVQNSSLAKTERKELCDWLINLVDKEKEEQTLPKDTMPMIESILETDTELRDKLSRCLVRYSVNTCNIDTIEESVRKLLAITEYQDNKVLTDLYKEGILALKEQLQDYSSNFNEDYIQTIYKNISQFANQMNYNDNSENRGIRNIMNIIGARLNEIKSLVIIRKDMSCSIIQMGWMLLKTYKRRRI